MDLANIVRRSLAMTDHHANMPHANMPQAAGINAHGSIAHGPIISLSGMIILLVTAMVFMIIGGLVSYSIGGVVVQLAIVEDPAAKAHNHGDKDDSDDAPLLPAGEKDENIESQTSTNLAMTRKLRSTFRHLRQQAGRGSCFRGLHILLLCLVASYTLMTAAYLLLPLPSNFLTLALHALVSFGVILGLSPLDMAWTHYVISRPRPGLAWYRRLAPRSHARANLRPTAQTLAWHLPTTIPLLVAHSLRLRQSRNPAADPRATALGISACILFAGVAFILVAIPAQIALVRVRASLLADDEEPIVPMDKTFGGLARPRTPGGPSVLSMRDAWRTFGWPSCRRVVKVYTKLAAIQLAIGLVAMVVLGIEIHCLADMDRLRLLLAIYRAN